MVEQDALQNAANSRFKTMVEDPESVPTQYDNFPFERPADKLWVRWSILPGTSDQVSTGGGAGSDRFRTPGVCRATIFAPVESGTKKSHDLAKLIVAAFRAVTASGVTYRTPSVTNIGRNGKWWVTDVEVPFYTDTIA